MFGPDGTELHVTLGGWKAATGSVTLRCKSGTDTASSNRHLQITANAGPCLDTHEAVLVGWHSDGVAHGASPGMIGVTQHNALIAAVPARH